MQKFLFAPWWNFYRLSFQDALIQGLCYWGFFIIILIVVSYYLFIKTYQKKGKQEINIRQENIQDSTLSNYLDSIQPKMSTVNFLILVGCDVLVVFCISLIIILIVLVGYKSLQELYQFLLYGILFIFIFLPSFFFLYRINHYYIPYIIYKVPQEDKLFYIQPNKLIRRNYKKTKQKYQTLYTFFAWTTYLVLFFSLTWYTKSRCIIELPFFEKFDTPCTATYATLGQYDSILKQINLRIDGNKKYQFNFLDDQKDYLYQYFEESPSDDQSLSIGNFFLPQNFTYKNAFVQQSDIINYKYSNIYDIENLKISVITNSKNFNSCQEQKLIILAGNNIQDFGQTQCSKSIMNSFNNSCKNDENYLPLQTYISVPGPLDTGSYWNYESANLQQFFTNSINLQDYNTEKSSEKQKVIYNLTNLFLIGQNVSISYIQMQWVKNDNIQDNLKLSENNRHILISPIAVSKCDDNNDYQDPAHRQIIQKYLIKQNQLGVKIILVIESSQTQPRYYKYENITIVGGGQYNFKYDDLGACQSIIENQEKQEVKLSINLTKFYFQFSINDKDMSDVEFLNF